MKKRTAVYVFSKRCRKSAGRNNRNIRYESDNSLIPEYISEGFASMCHMTVEEVENVYKNDIFASFHSDDSDNIKK